MSITVIYHAMQGWIQDFKLGRSALKKIRQAEGRRETFLGYFV